VGLREAKKEQMRRRLYESAMALFRERGFAETRVRDVINAVDVSEATFFNYFPTKEAVLHEASVETKRFYGAYLQNLVNRSDERADDRLRELARVAASVFANDRAFMAIVLTHTDLFFGSAGKDLDLANYELLTEIFRQGQRKGEFGSRHDPQQLAEIFNATQLLTILNWTIEWFDEATPGIDDRTVAAIDVVLRGCAA